MLDSTVALAGITPDAFVRRVSGGLRCALDADLVMSGFCNTAFV